MMNIVSTPSIAHGSVRRKPKITYPSPTAHATSLRIEVSAIMTSSANPLVQRVLPNESKVSTPTSSATSGTSILMSFNDKLERRKTTLMGPSLPLYHPLGRLASSLPDLDPIAFGLPVHSNMSDDTLRRFSNRSRRPVAKLRDEEEGGASPHFTGTAPTDSFELKDKPSPRKRRAAAAAAKRKRKDVDDGDATYPAKRSRNPRAAAIPHANHIPASEASPSNSVNRPASPPDGDAGGADDNKKPERRTTRSRANRARRDSVGSDATVTSASVSIAATTAARPGDVDDGLDESQPSSLGVTEGEANSEGGTKFATQLTDTAVKI